MSIYIKRKERGLTQAQLAAEVGTERSTVAKWETGKSAPKTSMLPTLARVLHCSVDELLGVKSSETATKN